MDKNFLSTEFRVPVTLLQTNACSPLAMNALADNIWDNFSSQSYKELPAVGDITYRDPFDGNTHTYKMPGGGRGYTRPASLVSLWSTAPYLLNNTVGQFSEDPSVAARMTDFDDAIHQMLWPKRRKADTVLGNKGVGWIDPHRPNRAGSRSRADTCRDWATALARADQLVLAWRHERRRRRLARANSARDTDRAYRQPRPNAGKHGSVVRVEAKVGLARRWLEAAQLHGRLTPTTSNEDAQRLFEPVARALYALSNCPDFEVNRGHYFGTDLFGEEPGLSDGDKDALIVFLKTL